ncbi:MAG: SCO family protein [Magnetococcus sp. DMHC-6]
MNLIRNKILLIIALLLTGSAVVATIWFAPTSSPPTRQALPGFWGEPRVFTTFTLTDHQKRQLNQDWFTGSWTLVFFGYTHCPDICPMALSLMTEALQNLKGVAPDGMPLRGLFISVDPDRDTPASLAEYVAHFDPRLTGATGQRVEIDNIAKQFGAAYFINTPEENDKNDYSVTHSSSIFFVDPKGHIVNALMNVQTASELQNLLIKLTSSP